ncbi:MAG: phage late control D family protein [Lachnospiraceae bacterium]|nr:phage late control D family protein [Lachnospiraceae bacterium]
MVGSNSNLVNAYNNLQEEYDDFSLPVAVITVGGKELTESKKDLHVTDIRTDCTSNYEASVASFKIFNCFDMAKLEYRYDDVKPYIMLGSPVMIAMGYDTVAKEVFRGFISSVEFVYLDGEVPGIEVHAMDVKGVMMANNYAKQIHANSYSEAVEEIFKQGVYQSLKSNEVFSKLEVTATPDKNNNENGKDRTIEMVYESDYEFVVKAAKKYNYEFFVSQGVVYFRKAKNNASTLLELGPRRGLIDFHIGYDITGLVGNIEVRNADAGKGKLMNAKKKRQGKISGGNKARQLIDKQTKVYIDPTAANKGEAEQRAEYLMEDMSYRFGTLEATVIGLPDLLPGCYVDIKGLGKSASNKFYLTGVRHEMEHTGRFTTQITGKAAKLE